MKNDLVASAVKVTPAVSANVWLWLKSRDVKWWVSVATIGVDPVMPDTASH